MAYSNFWGEELPESGPEHTDIRGTTESETLVGTALNDAYDGGGGKDTLVGLGGDDYYWLNYDGQVVVEEAGGGVDTIRLWQSYTLPDHVENLIVFGYGSYAAGNAMDNIIQGLDGDQILYGGFGDDVLIGGAGSDIFIVTRGEGFETIEDFQQGAGDMVRLAGSSFYSFEQVVAAMRQVGDDVVLTNGAEAILFRNTTIDGFAPDDFQLAVDYTALGNPWFAEEFDTLLLVDPARGTGPGLRPHYGYQGEEGMGSYTLPRNGEQQIYVNPLFQGTSDAPLGLNPFSVEDGILTITAQRVSPELSEQMWGFEYASGMLTTEWNYSQTYGYFEIRADLPVGAGLWPAFWLKPTSGQPLELDIMEYLGQHPNTVHHAFHSQTAGGGLVNFNPYADGFHTYGLLWTPEELVYTVDGVEVWRAPTPSDMHQPMYLIVNLAVGGYWAGDPDDTMLPAEMHIDYIRAYGLAQSEPGSIPPTPTLVGTASGEALTGTDGDDYIQGLGGHDALFGGAGEDLLAGGAGDDWLYVSEAGDMVLEMPDEGWDNVVASVSFAAPANVEHVILAGGDAINASGNELGNALHGNGAANVLLGQGGADILLGNGGDDRLEGGAGDDYLDGGLGADLFVFAAGSGHDRVAGFELGADRLDFRGLGVEFTLSETADGAEFRFAGGEVITVLGVDAATLTAGEDYLVEVEELERNLIEGTAGVDVLRGTVGPDELAGGMGDDWYVYDDPNDIITEALGGGWDNVSASVNVIVPDHVENIYLSGSASIYAVGNDAANQLRGNSGDNLLSGMLGDDMLVGEGGDDTLVGGGGSDGFIFGPDFGNDVVKDFRQGDMLWFNKALFDLDSTSTESAYEAAVLAAAAQVGGDVVITLDGGTITLSGAYLGNLEPGALGFF